MHVSVNVEFTHDELEKFAAGTIRRAVVEVVRDVGRDNSDRIVDLLRTFISGFDSFAPGVAVGGAPKAAASPIPPGDVKMIRCGRTDESALADCGWVCCKCHVFNGEHRAACRSCAHERCDFEHQRPDGPVGTA